MLGTCGEGTPLTLHRVSSPPSSPTGEANELTNWPGPSVKREPPLMGVKVKPFIVDGPARHGKHSPSRSQEPPIAKLSVLFPSRAGDLLTRRPVAIRSTKAKASRNKARGLLADQGARGV